MSQVRFASIPFLLLLPFVLGFSEGPDFEEFSVCGEVQVAGRIGFHEHRLVLKVHPGTQSEILLSIPDSEQLQAAPFLNRPVLVQGKITQAIRTYRGKIFPESFKDRVPDPLRPKKDSGFRFLKKIACEGTTRVE